MSATTKWLEVWFHDDDPPYFLWVSPFDDSGRIAIFDLRENKMAYVAKDYEDAYWWLREDEFEMVKGREKTGDHS